MPTQSKFVRFLRSCCCCVQNCEDDRRQRKTKGNNKSKKAPNNKKLRQKERRQRRNNKSKGLVETADDVQLPPKKTGRKDVDNLEDHPLTSLTLPEVTDELRPPSMNLPTETIVFENPPSLNPQHVTSFDCQVTPSAVSLSQILVLISSTSSLDDISTKYTLKENCREPLKASSVYSWSDLDISLHRLFHSKVPATPSLLSSGLDLRVPFQRLFDARDHSATSSFFSWSDATSCVERLFQESCYEYVSNDEDHVLSQTDKRVENQTRDKVDQEEETRVVAETDPRKENIISSKENMEEETRHEKVTASTDNRKRTLLAAPRPSCSGDGLSIKQNEANLQEREDGRQGEEETGQVEKSKQEPSSERKASDAFSRRGSDMVAIQSLPSAEVVIGEKKNLGIGSMMSKISPFPVDKMKGALIPKLNLPSHVYGERLSQFDIDRASRDTNACAINHTLIAVTYYSFGLQSGDLFESSGLKSLPVQKWLWKTINVGNLLHRSTFDPSDCIIATDAFEIVRSSFRLRHLVWKGSGGTLPHRLRMLPRNLSLDIIHPTNSSSSLAYHACNLNPENMEAMLYTINNSVFLLLPTLDERVVLIDIHPHPRLGGGALIMFCTKIEQAAQDMLNEFYFKTMKPFQRVSLGQGNIICCKSEAEGNKMIPNNLKDWIADV